MTKKGRPPLDPYDALFQRIINRYEEGSNEPFTVHTPPGDDPTRHYERAANAIRYRLRTQYLGLKVMSRKVPKGFLISVTEA